MKKRHYLTMIMVTMLAGLSMAQAQNPECMTNLSIYAEHVKVKNYDAAYELMIVKGKELNLVVNKE